MDDQASETTPSPPWGGMTKAFVALAVFALVGGLLLRFHDIIPLLVVAGILAYLVLPLVQRVTANTGLSWGLVSFLVFFLLVLVFLGASAVTGFAMVRQLESLFFTIQEFLLDLPADLAALGEQPLSIGPWELDLTEVDLSQLAEQALAYIQPLLSQASSLLSSLAGGAVELVGGIVFVFAVAYFVITDYTRVEGRLSNLVIPGYEGDLRRILQALANIWNRFLRGQMVMVFLAGVSMWLAMSILGVNFSLGLGLLAAIAKFVPIFGPLFAGAVAALVALFQPTNWLGMSPVTHALLVVIMQIVADQSLDYLVQPRVMGRSLNLHPAFILIGAIVAASLAGIIGLLLTAPAIATLMLLGRYIYRKMSDMSPWDPPIDAFPDTPRRDFRWLRKRLRRRRKAGED